MKPHLPTLAALLLVGCSSSYDPELLRNHIVAIDECGRPVDFCDDETLSRPEFCQRASALLDHAAGVCDGRWSDSVEAGNAKGVTRTRKLLFHIHGGLNNRETSLANGTRIVERMRDEPFDDWHYPIIVTWPSGGIESYGAHLFQLRAGEEAPIVAPLTSPFFLASDIGRGVARFPSTLYYGAVSDLQVGTRVGFGFNLTDQWDRTDRLYEALSSRPDGGSPRFDVRLGDYHRGFWSQAGRLLRYLVTLPVTVPITALFLDGMGESAWDVMKQRAARTTHAADEFAWPDDEDLDVVRDRLTRDAEGGFALFLQCLTEHLQDAPDDVRYEITFVAHSMGAFLVNEALAQTPDLPVTNVIYMAPACSIEDAEKTVLPFIRRRNGTPGRNEADKTHFHVLTLHPLAEQDEVNYWDSVPRGSLLEWIDNWYERPDSYGQRRLGKWINVLGALHLFADIEEYVHVKGFGVRSDSIPQTHGQFNDCPFWTRAFRDPSGPMRY